MEFFIKQYIDKITKEDIKKFAFSNNIFLTDEEVSFFYGYVKNNWKDILYDDTDKIKNDIFNKIDKEKALKINELFLMYKEKYKNYL